MGSYKRDQLVTLAKLCEQTERYDEMKEAMKRIVEMKSVKLNIEERNLLSVSYKNVVGARRSAWRLLHNIQQKGGYDETVVTDLMTKVLDELKLYSEEIIKLLDENILQNPVYLDHSQPSWYENIVFFYKMKADYLRYVAEVLVNNKEERMKYMTDAEKSYSEAKDIAEKHLNKTSSMYLGLILNFSVFYYEITEQVEKAIQLAKKAFDDAVAETENVGLDNHDYKDSRLILQLLRDNLTIWKSDQDDDDDDED